jgi:phosphatidate cytidylyltransferase
VKLGNLAARVATAIVLVPPLLFAIHADHPEWVWGVVFLATILAANEYFTMTSAPPMGDAVERWFGTTIAVGAAALFYWYRAGEAILVPCSVLVPALFYLFRFRTLDTVVPRLAKTSFGVIYAGVLLTYIALLKRDFAQVGDGFGHDGGSWVLMVLMTAFFGDTGAYFAGRAFGRTKLYPAVSPGKTWAGAFGGLAGSFLAAVLANVWFFKDLGWGHGAVVTIVGGMLGQCGDLVESMLKRAVGVKDSGKLLPGHGGMLDRIDAVLFIAPWMYLYAHLVWARGL